MNLIGTKLNSLDRKVKTLLVLSNDLLLAFICWLVFGPPMATIISDNSSYNLISIVQSQIYSFILLLLIKHFLFFSLSSIYKLGL